MTDTQTKKTKLDRWINVKYVFSVVSEEKLKNRRVLLVDDVITTGATVEACAQAILDAGCLDISILCIADVS